jgi:uncharacterized protein YybS (DUF2232 family)
MRLEVTSSFFLALTATVLLFLGGVMIPAAGLILLPLVPHPAVLFGVRHGLNWGVGLVVAATTVVLIFTGAELAFVYGLFAFIAGLLLALLQQQRSIEFLVGGVAGISSAVVILLLLHAYGSWTALIEGMRESLNENLAAAIRAQENMGFSQEGVDLLRERGPQIIDLVLQLLPSLLFISLGFVALLNVGLLCRRYPERRSDWVAGNDLREWKSPESLVWALIVCGFVLFIPGMEALRGLALNGLVVLAACYFAQGLAVVAYLFHKNNVPRFLRAVTYTLIFFQQIFTLMVVGLGLFDLW